MDYNSISKQISDLIGTRPQAEQKELADLQNKYNYQDTYNSLQGIRRNVSDTEKALADLPQQLQQRTAGTLMTSGQLGRLVNTETDPIAKNLATLNKTQGLTQQSMADINNLIAQGQQSSRLNYTDMLSNLQNQQSQLFQAQEAAKAAAQQRANIKYQQDLADANAAKLAEAQSVADFKSKVDNARASNAVESQGLLGPVALMNLIQTTTNPALKSYAIDKYNTFGYTKLDANGNPVAAAPAVNRSKTTTSTKTVPMYSGKYGLTK